MDSLHDIFLRRLDSLTLQSDFRRDEAGTPMNKLCLADKKAYLVKKVEINKNTVDTWYRQDSSNTVPLSDNLLRLAKHFHVSIDYLLGNADFPADYTEQYICDYVGLNYEAIAMLHEWKQRADGDPKDLLYAQRNQSLKALNTILSDAYLQDKKNSYMPDVLHFIGNYLISDKIVRERGCPRFKSGDYCIKLNPGDKVTTVNEEKTFIVDEPIITENITNNNKKLGVYEENHNENCYVLPISELYRTSSLKRIGEVLDHIIKRQGEKK